MITEIGIKQINQELAFQDLEAVKSYEDLRRSLPDGYKQENWVFSKSNKEKLRRINRALGF